MNIIECKTCGHSLLSTAHICTKCGTVKSESNKLVWLCAGTWLLLFGAVLIGVLM